MTVVARNIGRLGNNLFQIGCAIGYAKKYNYTWAADESNGHGEPYSAIHKVFPNLPKQHFGGGVRYHEHPHGICPQHGVSYDLCHFDYHEIPDLGPNVSLTGFYQSWKYFEHCKDEVKEVFKLPHVEGYEDYVSIHVRRGDYVQHSGSFPPIDKKYIFDAMGYMTAKKDSKKFIFFSDDIAWCKQLISNGITFMEADSGIILRHYKTEDFTFTFSEGKSELEDLCLMASCGHHIIANSSFSWWGAYLGHNPNRIVVSPSAETWFGSQSGVKRPVVDLIKPEWIQR